MRADAREIQDQAGAAEVAGDESARLLELHLTAALRAGNLHGAGKATASPQLVQNFVPGGSGVLQWPQVSVVLRFTPQAGQNFAWTVTFLPHCGHFFITTIWFPQAGQNRAVSGISV
jgi:hypothetical protein